MVMVKEGCDIVGKEDDWKEDRGWMNDGVRMNIEERKEA